MKLQYTLLLFLFVITISAQVKISENQDPPEESAILEIESNNKGLLIPRLTDEQRDDIANPSLGLFIFNISSKKFNFYDGTGWFEMSPNTLKEHDCGDAYDNDGDGFLDCIDFDCAGSCNCVECDCNDGIDNDGDGFLDCLDFDCINGTEFECNCNDGIDNDGDGKTDCEDPDCLKTTQKECDCTDGIDNDGDGFIDNLDFDCQ